MPNYDLDGLLHEEFERLCQSLLKKIIGPGTTTFGEGPDGGREATFRGRAPYPSDSEQWQGDWIFQVKFHEVRLLGAVRARAQVVADLRSELEKLAKKERRCSNFVLITNVPLSSAAKEGALDRIEEVAREYERRIPHVHAWGARDICRFLDAYPEVRSAYRHYITPGDLIAELLDDSISRKADVAETVRLYLRTCYQGEGHALLHQAVEVPDERVALKDVFVDLKGELIRREGTEAGFLPLPDWVARPERKDGLSLAELLLSDVLRKAVLIGGPGQGKSTLGQYLAQIHRAALLGRLQDFEGDGIPFEPTPRIPFRVMMRDFGQWLSDRQKDDALEIYLGEILSSRTARTVTSTQIHEIIRDNRCLVILDGLDEVVDGSLRRRMLNKVQEFFVRCDELKARLQAVATSRPTGYRDDLDPAEFCHLRLLNLDPEGVRQYASKWSEARQLDEQNNRELLSIVDECLEDSHVRLLMNTPLQVTILILVARTRGTPPKQREALFDEYLEVIYGREKAKGREILRTPKEVLLGLHKYLGYVLHEGSASAKDVGSVLREDDFRQHCSLYLAAKTGDTANRVESMVDQMIEEARSRLVLIVEPAPSHFGFEIRSIQEFFAAAHLVESAKDSSERYDRFRAIARSPHWRNVALFFSGRVGRSLPGEAASILEICRDVDRFKPDCHLHRGALLSLDIVADRCFVPSLALQRSALELGLEPFRGEAPSQCLDTIVSTLGTLSNDDRDLLKPLMHRRLEELVEGRAEHTETCLDCCLDLFGQDPRTLAILDCLFRGDTEEARLALAACFEHAVNPDWLAARLVNQTDKISLRHIGMAVLQFESFPKAIMFLRDLFSKCPLEESNGRSLIERLSTENFYRFPWHRPHSLRQRLEMDEMDLYSILETALPPSLASTTDQFIATFVLHYWVCRMGDEARRVGDAYWHPYYEVRSFSGRVTRKGKKSGNGPDVAARQPAILAPKRRLLHPARYIDETKEPLRRILAAVCPLLDTSSSNLPDYLRVQVWVLQCLSAEMATDEFRRFIDFYSDKRREIGWLSTYIHSMLAPIPIGAIIDDIADDRDCLQECQRNSQTWQMLFEPTAVLALVEAAHTRTGSTTADEIERRLTVYRLFHDCLPADYVTQIIPNITESSELRSDVIIRMLSNTVTFDRRRLKVDTQEAIEIINGLTECTKVEGGLAKIVEATEWILYIRDFNNIDLIEPYEELIDSIVEQSYRERDTAHRALVLLCLKATEVAAGLNPLVPRILAKLGQDRNANVSPEHIAHIFHLVDSQIVPARIGEYLRSHDERVRLGAMRLGKAMAEIISGLSWTAAYKRTAKHLLDWNLLWPLLHSEDEEERICGISLLGLSNYPRCPHLAELITMIESSAGAAEHSAWVTFLMSFCCIEGLRDSRTTARFLGDLLNGRRSLPNRVRSAALNSYWSTITRFDTGFNGAESKLGLPLGVTPR